MLRLLGFYLVEDMDSWGAKNEGLSLFLKFKWLPQGIFWFVDGVKRPHKAKHLLRTVFTPPLVFWVGTEQEEGFAWFVNESEM